VETLLDRAGELKRQLVEFSQQPRYARAFRAMQAEQGDNAEAWDETRFILLWDSFLLEHRLRNGRTVVEQFVDARPDLSPQDRQMLLGWRDVVSGVFEVQRRDGPALILVNLVDDLTYRARATAGTSVFRQMPKRSFLLTRLVAVGDEWMFSGPTTVLRRPAEREAAVRLALEMSLRKPKAAFRNPEKLARAWELQREERQRFIRFFGADLVVVPGNQAQRRLDEYNAFSREEILREQPGAVRRASSTPAPVMELPPEWVESETVAFIYDEDDGLEFLAEFGLVEEAFADPDLVRRRRHREQVLSYLHDDSVSPMVLRRLADRDPDKASVLFRRMLKRPRFDWVLDGEKLLRSAKPEHFSRPRLPAVTPVGERLAAYARR
jgi:hypothetical protein